MDKSTWEVCNDALVMIHFLLKGNGRALHGERFRYFVEAMAGMSWINSCEKMDWVEFTLDVLEVQSPFDPATLLRDIFGNPFTTVFQGKLCCNECGRELHHGRCECCGYYPSMKDTFWLMPPWVTPAVRSLAKAVFDDTSGSKLDNDRLLVLGDALEESLGDELVIAHVRSGGVHVRGCWAVDICRGILPW